MFVYKASRYHAPVEDEFDTLEEALKRARSDRDMELALPVEITDHAGAVVLDHGRHLRSPRF